MDINVQDFQIVDLAEDIVKQASIYQYYGDLLAEAEEKLSRLELQLEELSAQTEITERTNASKSGAKITEGYIKAHLAADKILGAIRSDIIAQERTVATLKNAVRAMDQKGDMLSNLVRMEVGQLYNNSSTIEATANAVRQSLNFKRNK